MSVEQLRSLVLELIEDIEREPDDDRVNEFDTQRTTFRPTKARTGTLDDLIAWLRSAPPPPNEASPPKTLRRM